MKKLIKKIQKWFIDRNLHTQDSSKQLIKLGEEYGELCSAHTKKNIELKADSIGDILVVLIGYSLQEKLDILKCLKDAFNEIKERKGKLVNGVFIKNIDLKK